jgi:hypothetical protein
VGIFVEKRAPYPRERMTRFDCVDSSLLVLSPPPIPPASASMCDVISVVTEFMVSVSPPPIPPASVHYEEEVYRGAW